MFYFFILALSSVLAVAASVQLGSGVPTSSFPAVAIFTMPTCPHCIAAKELLTKEQVSFKEIDVAAQPWRRRQLAALLPSTSRLLTMPQVFLVSSAHIGGNEELRAFTER